MPPTTDISRSFSFLPFFIFYLFRSAGSKLRHTGSVILCVTCKIFSCGRRTLSCGAWDQVPRPEFEPGPPALGAWSLSHWTTREVPSRLFSFLLLFTFWLLLGLHYFSWGLSLVVTSRGYTLLQYMGFSLWWLLLLQSMCSGCEGSDIAVHKFGCLVESSNMFPALAGRFLPTAPQRSPSRSFAIDALMAHLEEREGPG